MTSDRRPSLPDPPPGSVREDVPLAPLTTLGLGGPARWLAQAGSTAELVDLLRWAGRRRVLVAVAAGGSNLVVSDQGFDGLVVVPAMTGLELERRGDEVGVLVGAGETWDEMVERTVGEGLAGLECLSGIPGSTGATPIQNVGAYGQEVGEVVDSVLALDRRTLEAVELPAGACGFGYRTSVFRRRPERHVVIEVRFRLEPGGPPSLRYPELERQVRERCERPGLAEVRREVIALRRSKSMVLDDPEDPNRRSVGSFFVNPVVTAEHLRRIERRARSTGAVAGAGKVPRFSTGEDRFKVPAAWLIEASGFARGTRRGPVGLSSRHALALVHHGGGRTADLVAFAAEIRDAVRVRFGVTLRPEPTFLGFDDPDPLG